MGIISVMNNHNHLTSPKKFCNNADTMNAINVWVTFVSIRMQQLATCKNTSFIRPTQPLYSSLIKTLLHVLSRNKGYIFKKCKPLL
jgi:hypothetical protein